MDEQVLKERLLEWSRVHEERKERDKAKLERLVEEDKLRHRGTYRFGELEISNIKYYLGSHLEEMLQFLVGHKYDRSKAGYYYLWEMPFKVGYKGVFDLDKPYWKVPAEDLIWFWMECRRDGRSDDEWNFHSVCLEIKRWITMLETGAFKVPEPSVVRYHQEQRQKALRRSLADLFKEGKLESITLQRKFGDGRLKSKRVSLLTLRRALQEADYEMWGNVQKEEFWRFITLWMEDEKGHWIKFEKQSRKKTGGGEQEAIVLTLNGYETPEEERMREINDYHAEQAVLHQKAVEKADFLKKMKAQGEALRAAEKLKEEQETLAARAAMTPEQREEQTRLMYLKMIKESPFLFADFLKDDPSLSRYIPAECKIYGGVVV
jgi:hypothetical protein